MSWQHPNADLIEARHAVRFGPERNTARTGEALVRGRMKRLAVEGDREAVVLRLDAQGMPRATGDLHIRARELLPASLHDAVEADIVLERIRTHEIIVVR